MDLTALHEGEGCADQLKHDAPTKRGKVEPTRDYTQTPSNESEDEESREEQDSSYDSRESQSAGVNVKTKSPVHDNACAQAFSFMMKYNSG